MNFELIRASEAQKEVVENLMQYYFYDFSEFVNIDVEENGQFKPYLYLESYWQEGNHRFPYLIIVDGKYVGFVLVSYFDSEARKHFSMSEFFIMKKYRKSGLGKAVAHHVFDLHRGEWEVMQIEPNKPAQAFWRKVIGEYTNGNYSERVEKKNVYQDFRN